MFGFGSGRNSAASPRATRSPRAARTYFGFGGSKGAEDPEAKAAGSGAAAEEPSAEAGGRKSWLSSISSSMRSMSPRASRSPRSQRKSQGEVSVDKKTAQPEATAAAAPAAAAAPTPSKSSKSSKPAEQPAPAVSAAASTTAPASGGGSSSGEAKYLRPHLRVGDALNGRYEIMHDISTGSFGHVIACSDLKQNGRTVAVKVQDRVEAKYHKGAPRTARLAPPRRLVPPLWLMASFLLPPPRFQDRN